jgi:Cu-Zn family superoxide dismutase
MSSKPISAIAVFHGKKINGTVKFTEDIEKNLVNIDIDLTGLKKSGLHGFHVHEYGDMSEQCKSMCSHFNPFQKNHGGPTSKDRHVGDLGNLVTDKNGFAKYRLTDHFIKLRGQKSNIIGRGLIIHADQDDCGLGGNPESIKTGNAGERIACAVIGYAKNC